MKNSPSQFVVLLAICLLVAALGCKKHHTTAPVYPLLIIPSDTASSTSSMDSLKFQVGRQWTYMVQRQNRGMPIDTSYFTVSVVSDTNLNGVHLSKIKTSGAAYTPFLSSIDTLPGEYYIARLSSGWFEFQNLSGLDSISYSDSTKGEFLFSATLRKGRYQFPSSTIGYRHNSDYCAITGASGHFNCARISGDWNPGDHFQSQWFYVADKGLTRSYLINYESPPIALQLPLSLTVVNLVYANF